MRVFVFEFEFSYVHLLINSKSSSNSKSISQSSLLVKNTNKGKVEHSPIESLTPLLWRGVGGEVYPFAFEFPTTNMIIPATANTPPVMGDQ
jgi:hypothetical protein